MANLTNKKIKDTYEGLIKTNDNAAISGEVELTDGQGNGTGVSVSTDGRIVASGTVSFGSLKDTGEDITITKFVDEADGISSNDNDTSIPTSAAVKDYVDTNVTAQDLDFQGDIGTGAVDLDSQSLDISGGTGIDTSALDQTLTINIDSTVATLSDTQTLTNKTIDLDNNTLSNIETDNLKAGVLDTDLSSVSASDDTLASAKAIKNYVDAQITAEDLDFSGNTGTGDVDLDSETFQITGSNGITTTALDNTLEIDGSALQTAINTNTSNIGTNATDIAANASNISANSSAISANTSNISTNATNIATNTTNISSNATDIATNSSNISTNTGNIATNAGNIETNTGNIETNTTKLAGIEEGAQVNTVDSVNTQTGEVVLDADDIDDTSNTNKWSNAAEKTKLGYISVTQAVDLDSIEQKQNSQFKAIGLATDFGFRVLSDSGKVEGTQCIMENMEILILN